jgi:CheY-like chemotaxis protein
MDQQEPKKILVVEDEGAMRDIVAHKLQTQGRDGNLFGFW